MKLLVATDFNPGSPGGGPAVVRQMLHGFREAGNEIHWWSCRPDDSRGKEPHIDSIHRAAIPPRLLPAKVLPRVKAALLERLWAPWAAKRLAKTVAATAPDCVWAIPHNWSILPLQHALCSAAEKAVRWHATIQDYPDIHGNERRWGRGTTARLAGRQREIYRNADTRDATSLPMLQDLEKATGRAGAQMLHEGLEPEDFAFLERTPKPSDGKPWRIAYAGTILAQREFALFVAALDRLRAKGTPLTLEFWSAHSYAAEPWFARGWMQEHGHKNREQLVHELRACDWGFIPMALTDNDPRYNRFSFPTKFITYLAAGLPIISMGHRSSSVMAIARKYDVGVQLSSDNPDELVEEFSAVFRHSPNSSARYRPALIRCARDHFDAARTRAILWSCIRTGRASVAPNQTAVK